MRFSLWLLLSLVASFSSLSSGEDRRLVVHPHGVLGTSTDRTASVGLGDLDGDGDPDLVVANGRHWAEQNFVYWNDGAGFFRTATRLGAELATSYRVELVDVDGDGDLDAAVANDRVRKKLFINDGRGRFSDGGSFGRDDVPSRSLIAADVDGDGDPDLLVTNRGAPNEILYNDGRGGFSRSESFGTDDDSTIAVAVGDLDEDGVPELVLANRDAQQNVAISKGRRIPFGSGHDETRGVALGDIDGDSHLDIVTANIGERNGIYFGNGAGEFPRAQMFGRDDGRSYSVALTDFDRDGRLDVVIGNHRQTNAVYVGEALREIPFGDESHATYHVAAADVNGDGFPEIVAANSGAPNVVYFNAPAMEQSTWVWPSFRGPNASGVADGMSLPVEWDVQAPDWKTAIPGLGHSSPIVWGDRLFITTAVSENPDSIFVHGLDGRIDRRSDVAAHSYHVYCLDRLTGEVLWEREAARGVPAIQRHRKNSYASSTPATDGTHVVAYFGSEGLFTYDVDGRLLWEKSLGVIDAGASYDDTYDWGPASSPIIHDGIVILLADQQAGRSFMVAFDVETGDEAWRVDRDVISSFSTPSIFESKAGVALVTNGAEWMHGYDPSTGQELWRVFGSSKNTTPTPVVSGETVFITSGYRIKPIFALGAGGDVEWSTERDGSYMTTPVVYGDFLYTCQNNGVVSCYRKATGERVYQQRIAAGAFSASPIASDDKLYFTSEDGDVYVVRSGDTYELLATNEMGEVAMATPAAAPGQLIIRTQHHVWSFR